MGGWRRAVFGDQAPPGGGADVDDPSVAADPAARERKFSW